MQQVADYLVLLQHDRDGLFLIDCCLSLASAGGVGVQGPLQCIGDPEVIGHETARLVLEHAVHTGNRLHEVVPGHRLVQVHRVHARAVEARQPHVAHDYQFQIVPGILESLGQPLTRRFCADVWLPLSHVGCRSTHHDLDLALRIVVTVPLRPQLDDLVVEVHTDAAGHAHNHAFAVHNLLSLLEVIDQVLRDQPKSALRADHGLQRCPLGLQLLLVFLFLAFGDLLKIRIERWLFVLAQF